MIVDEVYVEPIVAAELAKAGLTLSMLPAVLGAMAVHMATWSEVTEHRVSELAAIIIPDVVRAYLQQAREEMPSIAVH